MFLLGTLFLVRAASSKEQQAKTCSSGTLSASVSPVKPSVSFQCGEPADNQVRSVVMKFSSYAGEACNEQGSENDVGTILSALHAAGQWSAPELTITRFPPQKEKICLLCTTDTAVTCKVVVDIAEEAASCTGKGKTIEVVNRTVAEKDTVYFKCANSDTLRPAAATSAYGDNCQTEESLPDGLVRRDTSPLQAYSLTLVKAPKTTKTICYACNSSTSDRPESLHDTCHIKITTQTTTQATTSQLPSHSTTASGTEVPRTPIVLACGIAFATWQHV